MLVQREVTDGVEVISLRGPVTADDALALAVSLAEATQLQPRAVLVDLTGAGPVAAQAWDVLKAGRSVAPGWPRPALVVCCDADQLAQGFARLGLTMHPRRLEGLAHVDDRSASPRYRICLPHEATSPSRARAEMAQAAIRLGCSEITDELSLVVSELVTNAVRHAEPPVELEIEVGPDEVLVAVDDGSPGRPAATSASVDAEGGRGLSMVETLCAETGVRPKPPGKTVWASLRREH